MQFVTGITYITLYELSHWLPPLAGSSEDPSLLPHLDPSRQEYQAPITSIRNYKFFVQLKCAGRCRSGGRRLDRGCIAAGAPMGGGRLGAGSALRSWR